MSTRTSNKTTKATKAAKAKAQAELRAKQAESLASALTLTRAYMRDLRNADAYDALVTDTQAKANKALKSAQDAVQVGIDNAYPESVMSVLKAALSEAKAQAANKASVATTLSDFNITDAHVHAEPIYPVHTGDYASMIQWLPIMGTATCKLGDKVHAKAILIRTKLGYVPSDLKSGKNKRNEQSCYVSLVARADGTFGFTLALSIRGTHANEQVQNSLVSRGALATTITRKQAITLVVAAIRAHLNSKYTHAYDGDASESESAGKFDAKALLDKLVSANDGAGLHERGKVARRIYATMHENFFDLTAIESHARYHAEFLASKPSES